MTPQDPLAQLRDIQLPATGGWWPPAPGWWLLAMAVVLCVLAASWFAVRQHRKHLWKRTSRHELARLKQSAAPTPEWFAGINALLKRTARQAFPDRHPEALTGQQWIEFLLETAPRDRIASRPVVEGMVASAWQPRPSVQPDQALDFARAWMEAVS
ncbi:DUF4381 domain-containing protein [Marinobacter daepoensis]|uniref:DUF4381 domain-containing protein n=1 Tax=Marinobacter daepoensis TaxID=262077 RepID=A0ABS3BDY9_9GAMM|nr:DUF4381 domain-containing protein [Marinobacter daepoensis]MBN7769570.1 DUF4381 domain-containing protein [Marinobacter daepoensis]MBY6078260.1 DUF4381 domain-containing protein [Marinobacter daepoensis]